MLSLQAPQISTHLTHLFKGLRKILIKRIVTYLLLMQHLHPPRLLTTSTWSTSRLSCSTSSRCPCKYKALPWSTWYLQPAFFLNHAPLAKYNYCGLLWSKSKPIFTWPHQASLSSRAKSSSTCSWMASKLSRTGLSHLATAGLCSFPLCLQRMTNCSIPHYGSSVWV